MNAVHVRNQKHELTPPRNRVVNCHGGALSIVVSTGFLYNAFCLFSLIHFPLSWRWPRWCTLRIPLGAALRFSVPQGGASLVWLASSTRDCIGSPRLEPVSLFPRLGFHPTSEGYSVGNLGYSSRYAAPGWVWRQVHGACSPPMLPCTTGALAALFAPAGSSLGVPSLRYGPMLPLHAPTLSYCWATVQPSRQTLGCALLAVNCHGGALSILVSTGFLL
ncbi:hypothetical protein V6N12_035413 [Hibiscus sabdariffa]|uniref:Uncharacterized protein n=1 Tax=Hibiscus sabdariffa TaxID=183260 RepID=A0ABR2EMP5_9ROSI